MVQFVLQKYVDRKYLYLLYIFIWFHTIRSANNEILASLEMNLCSCLCTEVQLWYGLCTTNCGTVCVVCFHIREYFQNCYSRKKHRMGCGTLFDIDLGFLKMAEDRHDRTVRSE